MPSIGSASGAFRNSNLVVGGRFLFLLLNATLLIAVMGSGIGTHLGASRLLYGMGCGKALPPRFFAAVDAKKSIPRNNVLFVGACTLVGVFLLTFQSGAELLNFGAFIGFMGVNAAALVHYKFRSSEKVVLAAAAPVAGFFASLFIWLNLSHRAQLLGTVWLLFGLALYYLMRRTGVNPGFNCEREPEGPNGKNS
jgi:putrescine importer